MDVQAFLCWLLHRDSREILLPGILPMQLDAVVFCYRCDTCRGRGARVFHLVEHVHGVG